MEKPEIRWLHRELTEWVRQGVVTEEGASRLRALYPMTPEVGRRTALLISSVLGALLVGAGVVLLLAHNWEDLTRPARAALALGLVVAAQLLAAWVRFRRAHSLPWREGTATSLMLAVGSAIALVGQTYQIPGDPRGFLLAWMLLSAGIVYLMDASAPAILYLLGIAAWAGPGGSSSYYYWLLAAVVAPHAWISARTRPHSNRTAFLFVAFVPSVAFGLGATVIHDRPGVLLALESGLFALLYLAARYPDDPPADAWRGPLRRIGAAGLALLAFVLTFRAPWQALARPDRSGLRAGAYEAGIALALGAALAWLVFDRLRRRAYGGLLTGCTPVVVLAGILVASRPGGVWPAAILANAYVLALGVATIRAGLRARELQTANAGLLLVAALVLARFFDGDASFVWRGAAFIAVGAGFLATNVWLLRRGREVSNER